ncbi:MAG: hypothetical protein DRH23_12685 [Deltaproteobacteria bacterium]|nr:MAG: hypothetical protein DRH23_12685 [Deltaproteobacteria bacterium]
MFSGGVRVPNAAGAHEGGGPIVLPLGGVAYFVLRRREADAS